MWDFLSFDTNTRYFLSTLVLFIEISAGSSYLCGSRGNAWVVTPFALSFELCNLESEGEVGEGTAPGARVTPLYHRSVDFADPHLVRFHYHGGKQKTRARSTQRREEQQRGQMKENTVLCAENMCSGHRNVSPISDRKKRAE